MIWCEHCRDHYPTDHYPSGEHGIGPKFGVTGMRLQAVDIIKDLAESEAPADRFENDYLCALCMELLPNHGPACPWLRAKEWVKGWDAL